MWLDNITYSAFQIKDLQLVRMYLTMCQENLTEISPAFKGCCIKCCLISNNSAAAFAHVIIKWCQRRTQRSLLPLITSLSVRDRQSFSSLLSQILYSHFQKATLTQKHLSSSLLYTNWQSLIKAVTHIGDVDFGDSSDFGYKRSSTKNDLP